MQIVFEWDPVKAQANLRKHRVRFEDVVGVFADPLALSIPDRESATEERWVTLGMSGGGRVYVVVHTHVEESPECAIVRIISARRPTRNEWARYEDG